MEKEKELARLFFMIKPDGMSQEAKIIEMIEPLAHIIASRRFDSVEPEKIEMLYEMHRKKNFYPYLIEYLKDKPAQAFLLGEREDVDYRDSFYADLAALVGATDPARARPGTIRSLSPDSTERSLLEKRAVRNLVHRSTTPEETEKEAAIFFWDYVRDHTKVEGEQGEMGRHLARKGDGIFYEERLESGLRKCNLLSSGEELIKYRDLDGTEGDPLKGGAAVLETLKNGSRLVREATLQLKVE
jgi:nucleoside diphosphate kinase